MSKVQMLRALLKQKLPADDEEEIFELFERTIAEYEEELCRLKEEIERQRKLLNAVYKSETEDEQELFVIKEEVSPDQQKSSCSGDQEDTELAHVKEEELWFRQEHNQELEESDIIKFTYSPVLAKFEDGVKPHSQLCRPQTQDNMETEHLDRSSVEQGKAENDLEGCVQSEPASNLDPDSHLYLHVDDMISDPSEAETVVSDVDWKETSESQSGFNSPKSAPDSRDITDTKPFTCSECKRGFGKRDTLMRHMRIHTGEKPFSCSECGKKFGQKANLNCHMTMHTGEKPFSCPKCGQNFRHKGTLKKHMIMHTGEKPLSCTYCGKRFGHNSNLKAHMIIHTEEKPFSCSECGKRFNFNSNLKKHMTIHTDEKPLSCSECDKKFGHISNLKAHMRIHTEEKPFCCSQCDKTFGQSSSLKTHVRIHTEEKPFSCYVCGKRCAHNGNLKKHMRIHTGEQPFRCSECGQRFSQTSSLKRHMKTHAETRNNLIPPLEVM
ncbi:zinc finger protein OZF-like [Thalassophryne amazonica]|uniref:zinc finger protein OZF-like n=1 Tax=Thalassophryne amazonica TaxID=390379 RepID=UPI001470EB98|nr:zinc finger protein OZF-like [Thalassophryne amazonica]